MNFSFEEMRAVRGVILKSLDGISAEQANVIPAGLSNNLAWQLGHLCVSTPLLCYLRAQTDPAKTIPEADKYRNGTRPEAPITEEEWTALKTRFISSLDELEQDYAAGKLNGMQPFATHTFGIMNHTIEDVLKFCSMHDTLHWGNMSIIKKLVSNNNI